MILPHRGPVLGLDELAGDARSHHLAQAVDVDGVDPQAPLDLGPHALGPGFGAEDADPHRRLARVDALTFELVRHRQHVGRRHQHHAGTEFGDEHDLALAEAARHGHDGAAQALGAVVRPESPGEEPIAEGIVDDVARPRASGIQRPRHQVRPGVDIPGGVSNHGRSPGRPARGMKTHALFARDRQHAERIGVAQIGLRREGEAGEILQLPEIVGMDACRLAFGAIGRLPFVGLAQRVAQPPELEGTKFIERDSRLRKQRRRHDSLFVPS